MRGIFLLIILFGTGNVLRAQSLNFEETVKYINERVKCFESDKATTAFKADRGGNLVICDTRKFNLFDAYHERHYDEKTKDEHDDFQAGFEIHSYGFYQREGREYQLSFNLDKDNVIVIGRFENAVDVKRVFKALLHLRTLCTQVKDPFD